MDTIKSKSLGRGLASLLDVEDESDITESANFRQVPLHQLIPGQFQPRRVMNEVALETLVASIREKGILQPILVRPIQHATAFYEIVAGERRWQAANKIGLEKVPVIINTIDDREALENALIENIQRDDLTPLEEAEGYQRLIDEFKYTQETLSQILGKSRSHLTNTLRLQSLSPLIKSYIQLGKLTAGHGRALVGHSDAENLALKIIKNSLNVRQTEKLVRPQRQRKQPIHKEAIRNEDCLLIEEAIHKANGIRANLSLGQNEHKLTLLFEKMEDLDKIIQKLCH